jgi:polar amino acid transport system permease protein
LGGGVSLHEFAIVWGQREQMIAGLLTTLQISALAAVLAGVLVLVLFALSLLSRRAAVARGLRALIDTMRCIPFMLLCYLLYYGLPYWGIRLDNWVAGITALTLYNAAYIAELLRGAWLDLPAEYTEAGAAFGFHGWRLVGRVILPPVLLQAVPMLGNQFIQIIKDSAFLVIIAVQELTYAANEIQAIYYVPFASFVVAVLCYWLLCVLVETGVRAGVRFAELRR